MFVKIYSVYCQAKKISQSPVQGNCNTKYLFLSNAANSNLRQKKKISYQRVKHSKMLILTITFQYTEKSLTENISFCSKHSNTWNKVTYPYFSASSLASSSFTILWSSRSLLFPHNTMSGFSQYACICSWPGSTNRKRGHNSLPHTAPRNTPTNQARSLLSHSTSALALRSQRTGGLPLSHTQGKTQGNRSLAKLAQKLVYLQLRSNPHWASTVSCQERIYFPLQMDDAVWELLYLDIPAK